MDDLSKNHAKFLLLYHLIFVGNYRKKLLIPYGDEVKRLFEEIAARSDFSFEADGRLSRIIFTACSKVNLGFHRWPSYVS